MWAVVTALLARVLVRAPAAPAVVAAYLRCERPAPLESVHAPARAYEWPTPFRDVVRRVVIVLPPPFRLPPYRAVLWLRATTVAVVVLSVAVTYLRGHK